MGREEFLKVAIMANTSLKRNIEIENQGNGKVNTNKVITLTTFEKGEKIRDASRLNSTEENKVLARRISVIALPPTFFAWFF